MNFSRDTMARQRVESEIWKLPFENDSTIEQFDLNLLTGLLSKQSRRRVQISGKKLVSAGPEISLTRVNRQNEIKDSVAFPSLPPPHPNDPLKPVHRHKLPEIPIKNDAPMANHQSPTIPRNDRTRKKKFPTTYAWDASTFCKSAV